MKTKIKKLPQAEVELEIEVSVEEFEEARKRALKSLSKDIRVDGFREGKVPPDVVEKKVGQEHLMMEAARYAADIAFNRAIEENELEPISRPKIDILKLAPGNPFSFKASFVVLPEVELPDYQKMAQSVKEKKFEVEDKEIEQVLQWLQKSRAKLNSVERAAAKGDFVEIEFSSPQVKNGAAQEDAFILGEGQLVKGFEENLVGMKPGEKKLFSVEFPKDYFNNDLAGQQAEFEVFLKGVKEMELSEINDEFAKTLGDFKDLKSVRENIKKGLLEEKRMNHSKQRREDILKKIEESTAIDMPRALIEAEKERRLHHLKHRIQDELKVSFEEYLEKSKKSEAELMKTLEKESEKEARRFLILKEIAKKEKIEALDKEIEEETNKILARYPDAEQAKKEVDLEGLRGYTEGVIINEKTLERLESFGREKERSN